MWLNCSYAMFIRFIWQIDKVFTFGVTGNKAKFSVSVPQHALSFKSKVSKIINSFTIIDNKFYAVCSFLSSQMGTIGLFKNESETL